MTLDGASAKGLSSTELTAIVQSWQAGAISQETMFDLFRRGEVLPAGRTDEQEARLAEKQKEIGKAESASRTGNQAGTSNNQRSSPGLNLSLSLQVSLLSRVKAYALGAGLPPAGERRLGHVSAQAGVDPQGAAGANLPAGGFPFSIGPQAAIDCAWTTAGN